MITSGGWGFASLVLVFLTTVVVWFTISDVIDDGGWLEKSAIFIVRFIIKTLFLISLTLSCFVLAGLTFNQALLTTLTCVAVLVVFFVLAFYTYHFSDNVLKFINEQFDKLIEYVTRIRQKNVQKRETEEQHESNYSKQLLEIRDRQRKEREDGWKSIDEKLTNGQLDIETISEIVKKIKELEVGLANVSC